MSLDKAILHNKERRKPYRGSKAFDPTCRNHGGDDWSESDRTIGTKRRLASAERSIEEFEEVHDASEENGNNAN